MQRTKVSSFKRIRNIFKIVLCVFCIIYGLICYFDGEKDSLKDLFSFAITAAIAFGALFKRPKEQQPEVMEEPVISQHWLLCDERKSRGMIRIGNMPQKKLQECIDTYRYDYGEEDMPDDIRTEGTRHILTFESVDYGSMCSWVALLARPDKSTQYEVKGWFTMDDLSQDPDLEELSGQTIMLFVPTDDKDYDSVYFATPDSKCYKQEFGDAGTLERDPNVRHRYQDAPW